MTTKMNWDAAADRELLLAIIRVAKVTINNDEIAGELSQKLNVTLTTKAISNRIFRLKQMANGPNDKGDADDTTKPAKASKGGKKRSAADDDEADDTKPVKKTKGKKKTTKTEVDDEDDADAGALIKHEPVASDEAD